MGRAPIQVEKFLEKVIKPVLEANKEELGATAEYVFIGCRETTSDTLGEPLLCQEENRSDRM